MEEALIATFEGLAEDIEYGEEPMVFQQGEWDTHVILGLDFSTRGRGEGSEEGRGRDEPTDTVSEPSDFEGDEEEEEEEEEMTDQNLEWMTQGPLALLGVLHKMLKWVKRINIKFNPENMVNAKDHLDNFYLQLQSLVVCYDVVAWILFPCTLDSCAVAWYHILPPNSI